MFYKAVHTSGYWKVGYLHIVHLFVYPHFCSIYFFGKSFGVLTININKSKNAKT
jgi:hypothetical protein